MILVTGSTGNVGGALVSRLSTAGVPVRALVRSPTRADDLRGYDVDLAIGTYEDPASLAEALEGVDRVFLLSPAGPRMAEQELALVQAASGSGVRVVKLAAAGIDGGESAARILAQHQQVVRGLADSGLPHTVLAPGSFMQNLLGRAADVQEGVLPSSTGDGAVGWVDARDVAAVAAHVLTTDGHDGATYTITGPEALTAAQVAQVLAQVLEREVAAREVAPEQARDGLVERGVDPWLADGLAELDALARDGRASGLTDEVAKATGAPARGLAEFVQEHRAAFL